MKAFEVHWETRERTLASYTNVNRASVEGMRAAALTSPFTISETVSDVNEVNVPKGFKQAHKRRFST